MVQELPVELVKLWIMQFLFLIADDNVFNNQNGQLEGFAANSILDLDILENIWSLIGHKFLNTDVS